MDLNDVITEFGSHYIAGGQNEARMVQQLNQPAVTETLLTPIMTDDTLYQGVESQFTRIVQPFQRAWTPLNPLSFKPVKIQLFNQKIDLDEFPHLLEGTWLGFLAANKLDPIEWPFIRWYMEKRVIPQIPEDMELNEIWGGVYVAPTPGTPGAAGTAMDGLRKIRNGHITEGRTMPASMGAIPDDNLGTYQYLEDFADFAVSKKYQKVPMVIGMSESVERRARRGKRQKYGLNPDTSTVSELSTVEDTKLSFLGLPSMEGSDAIWCSPIENVCYFRKASQKVGQFKIESIKRTVSMYSDFWNGVGVHIPEIFFTNDQDLGA